MSDEYEFRDLRQDILDCSLDDVVDVSLRSRVRRFVNSNEEQRIRSLAQDQGVNYGFAHSLVKGLYAIKHNNERKGMPHMYDATAKLVVRELGPEIISNAAHWCYVEAKRNGLVATFDEDLTYDFPLENMNFSGLDVYKSANRKIIALFDDAVSVVNPALKPFQISGDSAVLSRVGGYFSPKKDAESLLLLYQQADQRRGKFVEEEL